MSLRRNVLAGLINSTWTVLLGLAVVPMYLKYLGIEAYGLIVFFMTLQALLQLKALPRVLLLVYLKLKLITSALNLQLNRHK